MLLAAEQGATGVVVVNNRVSVGSVVKMNLGELTHRLYFKNQKSESNRQSENPNAGRITHQTNIWYHQRSGLKKLFDQLLTH